MASVTKILYEKEVDFIPGVRSALHRLTSPFAPDQRVTLVPVDTLHDSSNSFVTFWAFLWEICLMCILYAVLAHSVRSAPGLPPAAALHCLAEGESRKGNQRKKKQKFHFSFKCFGKQLFYKIGS